MNVISACISRPQSDAAKLIIPRPVYLSKYDQIASGRSKPLSFATIQQFI